mgnify:CR=1 FL=1
MEFYQVDPSLENYWRSIILFGRNVASYKFALAKSLYELTGTENDLIPMESIAESFSRHICGHLKHSPKQITSKSSKFIESCVSYNQGDFDKSELIAATTKRGFSNVIDAFHNVNNQEISTRFFIDERRENRGIRLTDNFFTLGESLQFENFENETEARWRLVERGWELGISRNLVTVEYDIELKTLYTTSKERRSDVSSCRDSLNGYQKGHCFYCNDQISIQKGAVDLADVDHFFPWMLRDEISNINGVWNLVLACNGCNRGENGKFARVPTLNLLRKLHKRNEYFINSHLPLRETLIRQTGNNELTRRDFLQSKYNAAKALAIHEWEPELKKGIIF